jgi:hypothetical protein
MGPGPLQRGDNDKMQKFGEFIEKVFPWEPLSQNRSYLHESFLRYCRFMLVQIILAEGQGVGQKRKNYFYGCILERIWKENEISGQFQSNLVQTFSCMIGIQVCSNEIQVLFKGGIITKA